MGGSLTLGDGFRVTGYSGDNFTGTAWTFTADAADSDINVGWDEQLESHVEAPAYDGLTDLQYAHALPASGSTG